MYTLLMISLLGLTAPTGAEVVKTLKADDASYTFTRGVNISHWLSQNYGELTYAAPWFGKEDVVWIADQGFDHIRVPVDYRFWLNDDGSLNEEAIVPFDEASQWAHEQGLGVILDMHYLPGANFSGSIKNSLFTDDETADKAAAFWDKVAARYADEGPWLRFELLNEPVAEHNAQLNPLQAKLLEAVRKTNPTRVVYLTSNRWGSFRTVYDLDLPDDRNIALTLHFYEPFPFTHQSTSWTELKPPMEQVDFPGTVPDLSGYLPASHGWMRYSEGYIDAANSIDPRFEELALWHRENAPGLEIHIGEFGVFQTATPESIRNYCAAVVEASERHGFAWAVWDYRGGFAVRQSDGSPSAAMEGLALGVGMGPE